ncbi:MAG: CSLREA domain-containing protein [Chloroflexota bacterium]
MLRQFLVAMVAAGLALLWIAGPAYAATITVTSAGDAFAADGVCTLREAIQSANNNSSVNGDCTAGTVAPDVIQFNIPGDGLKTINPNSGLLPILSPTTLDATTQLCTLCGANPHVELDGTGTVAGTIGLRISSGNVTIRGFSVRAWPGAGIASDAGVLNAVIEGNFVGLNAGGNAAAGNGIGLDLQGAGGMKVGGATAAERNVISGNLGNGVQVNGGAAGAIFRGNYVGLGADGVTNFGNAGIGVQLTAVTGLTLGGTVPGAGNVISGNTDGVVLSGASANNRIEGNFVGTTAAGDAAVGNGPNGGVRINGAGAGNVIGSPNGRNVVAASATFGIQVQNTAGVLIQNNFVGTNAAGTAALPNVTGIHITGSANTAIGGGGVNEGNLVSGNSGSGISVEAGSNNTTIRGNRVGTNAAGSSALGNGLFGLYLSAGTVAVGGPGGHGNLISGNASRPGINVVGATPVIEGNLIGTDTTGTLPIPNSSGIIVDFGPNSRIGGTVPGTGNTIAFNTGAGVSIPPAAQDGIAILGNRISSNGALGIELEGGGVNPNDDKDPDAGSNQRQNYPVISSAVSDGASTTIFASLNSLPNTNGFRIEVFHSPSCDPLGNGEGETLLGSTVVNTDANGNAAFGLAIPLGIPLGRVITATATSPTNGTSEFSACVPVVAPVGSNIGVSPIGGLTTTESGGQAAFTVALTQAPLANVTINVTSSNPAEGTVSPGQLVFTPANGLVAQVVTITGVDDAVVDGSIAYTIITSAAASADARFNGQDPSDVQVTNLDNDVASGTPGNPGNPSQPAPPADSSVFDPGEPNVRRLTEQGKLQRARTNRGSQEDERAEGNALAVDTAAQPTIVTIANRDGLVTIVLLCRDGCDTVHVGDYVEVDGWKEHEALFYADRLTARRVR